MRGDFRAILLAKSLPYTNERPGGPLVARPVSECKSSKKCLQHFFDTLRPEALLLPVFLGRTDLIIIIDNDNDLKYPTHKPKYSLVCRGFKGNILDVNKIINADTILLSRDLNKRRHDKYDDSCQTHNIPYISLRDTCFHKVLIN